MSTQICVFVFAVLPPDCIVLLSCDVKIKIHYEAILSNMMIIEITQDILRQHVTITNIALQDITPVGNIIGCYTHDLVVFWTFV